MDKKNYTIAELIQEPSFRRVVKGTAEKEEIDRWSLWMEASGENREKAKEAASVIAGFSFDIPNQPDVEKEWAKLYKDTFGRKGQRIGSGTSATGGAFLKWIYRIAAVLVLGVCVGYATYIYSGTDQITKVEQITQERTVKSGPGEQKTVKFSDGSKIIMNSNSTLTYQVGLLQNQTVKVVLEGEAYFDAESDSSQKEPVFEVHTPDGIIRDIGTEFLVRVEEDRSKVVLQEGEVEVNTKDKGQSEHKVAIKAGEMLEFDKSSVLLRKSVNATLYTSWATGFMEFSGTSIQEFAAFVERRFDVKVQITNPEVAAMTLDGAVYFESMAGLVRSVSEVTKIPVYQSKDRKTVFIGNKQN